jgi:hypothetical protein
VINPVRVRSTSRMEAVAEAEPVAPLKTMQIEPELAFVTNRVGRGLLMSGALSQIVSVSPSRR